MKNTYVQETEATLTAWIAQLRARLTQLRTLETAAFDAGIAQFENADTSSHQALVLTLEQNHKTFDTLLRCEEATSRAFHRAVTRLEALRNGEPQPDPIATMVFRAARHPKPQPEASHLVPSH